MDEQQIRLRALELALAQWTYTPEHDEPADEPAKEAVMDAEVFYKWIANGEAPTSEPGGVLRSNAVSRAIKGS